MKRINSNTGKPFKWGDIREDGKVFNSYGIEIGKKSGFNRENWVDPEKFKQYKTKRNKKVLNRANPKIRACQLVCAARKRGVVTITNDWVANKIIKGYCELTGLPFDLNKSNPPRNPYAPSLDRIDASIKEYSENNTRVVLSAVNTALNQYGDKLMLPILEAMVLKIKEKLN